MLVRVLPTNSRGDRCLWGSSVLLQGVLPSTVLTGNSSGSQLLLWVTYPAAAPHPHLCKCHKVIQLSFQLNKKSWLSLCALQKGIKGSLEGSAFEG